MNGPEHYARAEELIQQADQWRSEDYHLQTGERKTDVLAEAQVHATLALAAATVDAQRGGIAVWESWPTQGGR